MEQDRFHAYLLIGLLLSIGLSVGIGEVMSADTFLTVLFTVGSIVFAGGLLARWIDRRVERRIDEIIKGVLDSNEGPDCM